MPNEQFALDGTPPDRHHPNNLPRRLIDNEGIVIPGMWLQYGRTGESIGDCRACGSEIHPERPIPVSNTRTDYVAVCSIEQCRKEVPFPNGRTGRSDDTTKRGRRRKLRAGEKAIQSNVPAYLQDGE